MIQEMPLTKEKRDTIGERIRELRKKVDLTQQELADLTGMQRSMIAKFEVGTKQPNLVHLESLCEHLDCTSEDILGF